MLLDLQNAPRCGAKTKSRKGKPCQSLAMPNGRYLMHKSLSPGSAKGNQNALKHSASSIAARQQTSAMTKEMRRILALALG